MTLVYIGFTGGTVDTPYLLKNEQSVTQEMLQEIDEGIGELLKFDPIAGDRVQRCIIASEEVEDESAEEDGVEAETQVKYSINGWETVE